MKIQRLFWIISLLTFTLAGAAGAEEAQAPAETASSYMEMRRQLWELKEKDPEAFKAKIAELRSNAQKRLDKLKESDPETYQRVLERRKRRVESKFEHWRQEDPQTFERIQGHREGMIRKRVEWIRQNDPEKYERIQQWRQQRAESGSWSKESWQPEPKLRYPGGSLAGAQPRPMLNHGPELHAELRPRTGLAERTERLDRFERMEKNQPQARRATPRKPRDGR